MIERRRESNAVIESKDAQSTGTVKVRAASFLNLDRGREIILPGTYAKHLARFATKGRVFLDHTHSTEAKVGGVVAAYEDPTGLIAIARFGSDAIGQKTRSKALAGELIDVSIGHQVFRERFVSPAEVKAIWARYGYQPTDLDLSLLGRPGKVRVIEEAEAAEFSFVGIPMNDNAETLEVKNLETKKGAVLSSANAQSLKQAYTYIRRILKSARIEDLEDEPATQKKSAGALLPTQGDAGVSTKSAAEKSAGAELRAKRLRVELELLDLKEPELVRVPKDEKRNKPEEASQRCLVTQV